jgi:hypothetical protein
VADFGVDRRVGVAKRMHSRTYCSLSHLAPEVLSSDTFSKVSLIRFLLWLLECTRVVSELHGFTP